MDNKVANRTQSSDPAASRLVAVAGGKGGVGKSVLSANLAIAWAQGDDAGRRPVVAVDLDVGCGNLNWCLGVGEPERTINHFLVGEVEEMSSLSRRTSQRDLRLICSSPTGLPEARLDGPAVEKLLKSLARLGDVCKVLDLGAGVSEAVLDLFLAAGERLIVVNPDPLSLQNSFLFLKTLILRFLLRELAKEDFLSPVKSTLQKIVAEEENLNVRALISRLKQWDQYAAYVLAGMVDDLRVRFVVNLYRGGSEERSFLLEFHKLLFRDLCLRNNLSYLGFVHFDRAVQKAIRGTRPFLLRYPRSRAALDIQNLAARLMAGRGMETLPPVPFPEEPQSGWWRSAGRSRA